jgi:hypothetical protein
VLCGTLQRESLADFGKMVPDFKKVVPGLVTKRTALVNRKMYLLFIIKEVNVEEMLAA